MISGMTYAGSGVSYDAMDPFKQIAQTAARGTARNVKRFAGGDFREFGPSRGESAYLIETPESYLAHVEEGLGTKSLIADEMHRLTGELYYGNVAQDTVAMIVNDMITVGALPLSVAMHLAVGDSGWFSDEARSHDLIAGWANACNLAGCAWGGGETPTLKDVVLPGAFVLSGSAVGLVKPKERLITAGNIRCGDVIILVESSGIHANGLTLVRRIAEKLPDGYLTRLEDGRTYGEALLDPTHIYFVLMEDCFFYGLDVHYAVNITGHGWRKLMRAPQSLAYVIESLPSSRPIFSFLQEHGPVDDREAYGTLNMGAGFAFYVPDSSVDTVRRIAASRGFRAFRAGYIERSDEKKVVILPKGLEYSAETLSIR